MATDNGIGSCAAMAQRYQILNFLRANIPLDTLLAPATANQIIVGITDNHTEDDNEYDSESESLEQADVGFHELSIDDSWDEGQYFATVNSRY